MKIHGYALVNKDGHYLFFEQESSKDLHVYTTNSETHATLFETIDEAVEVSKALNTNKELDGFLHWCQDYDIPYAIAEITILAHADEVKRLVIE